MRTFDTGATRDIDKNKIDYEGFLSPIVLKRFGEYMLQHQVQADGNFRESDNWQKGIPREAYIKSAFRHFHEWWTEHRKTPSGIENYPYMEDALCALMFNVMGYLHEHLKAKAELDDTEIRPALDKYGNPVDSVYWRGKNSGMIYLQIDSCNLKVVNAKGHHDWNEGDMISMTEYDWNDFIPYQAPYNQRRTNSNY